MIQKVAHHRKIPTPLITLTIALVLWLGAYAQAGTLTDIQKRGYLKCGVGHNDFGFAEIDEEGVWKGFDIDFCRAIAVASLGSVEAVEFVTVDSQSRLPALADKKIDVLFRTTTWTFSRDAGLPIEFAAIILFDRQRVISSAELDISSLSEATGETLCVNKGTTSLQNIRHHVQQNNLDIEILKLETQEGRWNAFLNGRCDLMTSDYFDLYAGIQTLAPDSGQINFLDEVISEEPLSVAVRDNDQNWVNIVRWVINVTILAEKENLKQADFANGGATISDFAALGASVSIQNAAAAVGLAEDWVERILANVGNYGEIYNRNLGDESKLTIERGSNNIWTNGGLIYSPPFR